MSYYYTNWNILHCELDKFQQFKFQGTSHEGHRWRFQKIKGKCSVSQKWRDAGRTLFVIVVECSSKYFYWNSSLLVISMPSSWKKKILTCHLIAFYLFIGMIVYTQVCSFDLLYISNWFGKFEWQGLWNLIIEVIICGRTTFCA